VLVGVPDGEVDGLAEGTNVAVAVVGMADGDEETGEPEGMPVGAVVASKDTTAISSTIKYKAIMVVPLGMLAWRGRMVRAGQARLYPLLPPTSKIPCTPRSILKHFIAL
jgi:hypothetical protein